MNSLTFVKGQGGLGRPLPGLDYVSGLLFYSDATLPSGFDTNNRIKTVYSVADAVALGITNTSLGETKSTATYLFTNKGAAGDTMVFTCATSTGTVTLASYTQVTADVTSTTTAAARLAAEINLGTPTHGFTASPSTATVTITAAPGQGIFLNTGTPYVATIVGTIAGTLTQNVVPGVASDIDILYYHISEFFRMQPKGKLYVSIQATADVATFSKYTDLIDFAQGEIRQVGIYEKSTAFATAHCTTLQALYNTASTNKKPAQIIYNAEISGTSDLTTLSNLRLLSAANVSVCIGQDGAGKGYKIYKATGKSIGVLGTVLGSVALAAVNEDIAWYGKFNIDSGTELDTLAFANGNAYTAISDGTRTGLDTYGYIFCLKVIDLPGSYFNDSHTCVALTSDYAYIELGRTIDKAIRGVRAYVTPALGSPVTIDASTGRISEDSIAYFEGLAQTAMDQMMNNGEISGYQVIINPTQNVVSTGKLTIALQIVPKATARTIVVNIGYVVSLTA